jgi:methionyl-tRNA formyltransferase
VAVTVASSAAVEATTTRRLRIAFFGTPSFALPSLERIAREHQLLLVVAQPDRPAGRGQRTQSPATVERARQLGIPVAQPERLRRNSAFAAALSELDLDVAVTAAYGQILPESMLTIPKEGFLNVHASLLPRWRGAAPIQHALMAGDFETGVCIMQTEAGLDTGPVRLSLRSPIAAEDDANTLSEKLANVGAEALSRALTLLASGKLPSTPQDASLATLAPRLTRDDGRIRWDDSSMAIANRHRGVTPWPGSWCSYAGTRLKVHTLVAVPQHAAGGTPGEVLSLDPEGVIVACGSGAVRLERVQSEGRPQMPARDWANGASVRVGVRYG